MKIIRTTIPDVLIIEPKVHEDGRGFFYESYNEKAFEEFGGAPQFVQDNHVKSCKGVLRGLHFQKEPMAQGKLVRAITGSVFDVAVDIRKDSPTYGQHVSVVLDSRDKKMIYVPEGLAHGYLTLEDDTEVLYKVTNFYSPQDDAGIIWSDPELNIKWPELDVDYVLSEKDQKLPSLKELIPA